MQTAIYKITFEDGREYRVFCANSKQVQRFRATMRELPDNMKVEVLTNGIHTIKQWEAITKQEND